MSVKYFRKQFLLHQFPQNIFAKKLKSILRVKPHMRIVDVPCGCGNIAYSVAKSGKAFVEAYDISKDHISKAKKYFTSGNLTFQEKDISDVLAQKEHFDVALIINSLFLLPNIDALLAKLWTSLKTKGEFHLIIPNIYSKNFVSFQKANPDVNLHLMDKDDLIRKIEKTGFSFQKEEGIVNIAFYGRNELKYMSYFGNLYLTWLNAITEKKNTPSYYLIQFEKKISSSSSSNA